MAKLKKKSRKIKENTHEFSQLKTTSKSTSNFQEMLRLPADTSSGNVELLNPQDQFEIEKHGQKTDFTLILKPENSVGFVQDTA